MRHPPATSLSTRPIWSADWQCEICSENFPRQLFGDLHIWANRTVRVTGQLEGEPREVADYFDVLFQNHVIGLIRKHT